MIKSIQLTVIPVHKQVFLHIMWGMWLYFIFY